MKVMGFQLLSSSSAQKKQYTVLVTDTGHLLKHNGGRALLSGSTKEFRLGPGQMNFTILSDAQKKDIKSVLEAAYKLKASNAEYDSAYITEVPIELSDQPYVSNTIGRAVTQEFYEKAGTPGIMGIANFMMQTRPADLDDYAGEYAKFSRMLTEDDYDPTQDTTPAVPVATHFTEIEEGNPIRPNGQEYRPREILGHTDVALIREFRKKNIYVRLAGPPGGGKTALAEAAFGKDNLVTVSGHGDMTVANFVGTWIPRRHRSAGESEWEWVDGPLTHCMKEGLPFFVDEILRIPNEVLNILISATDDRRMLRLDERPDAEPIRAKEGFYVIAGYNPDTLGAKALDEALVSRFKVQINVYTDFDTARALGVPEFAVKIAENMETLDREDRADFGSGVWVPQMRELLTVREIIDMGAGEEFALATLVASCPREIDIPNLVKVIKAVTNKDVSLPTLGGLV